MTGDWRALALCAVFPDLPWLVESQDRSAAGVCAMTAVCGGCPVRSECAGYAERHRVTSGFWAGRDRDTVATSRGEAA